MAARGPGIRHASPRSSTRRSSRWSRHAIPSATCYLARVLVAVRERLSGSGVGAEVTGRPKHHWSIYEKMVVRGKEFADIYDLVGIRVVVGSEKDCWAALGSIHAIWSPVQGRFKDYINSPKFNLYQSLHTTVVGLEGKPIEVQIRTQEMHRRAEYGIAAHWGYKAQATVGGAAASTEMAWLQRIVDWQADTVDPFEFLETLKLDLDQDEVYVFTPKGKVIALPARSTPVDFAYAIHTEVGHHCIGGKVNGRLVPLDTQLSSADTVEIITSKVPSAGPSRDWLQIVASPRARNKIRQWFSRETARGRDRERPRGAHQGAAARGSPDPEAGDGRGSRTPGRDHELQRHRGSVRRGRRGTHLGALDRPARRTGASRRRERGAAPDDGAPELDRGPHPRAMRGWVSTSRASTT